MKKKYFVIDEGGTGERVCESHIHMQTTRKLYSKETRNVNIYLPIMDSGGSEIGEILKLLKADKDLDFHDPVTQFSFLMIADKLRIQLEENKREKGEKFCLKMFAPEYLKNCLLLTKELLEKDLTGGYYGDLTLGSLFSEEAVRCAMETEEDKKAGFTAIINEVVNSNGIYQVLVALIGSGIGGEGRTNLCTHPILLRKYCIEAVMRDLNRTQAQAKAYVDNILKIAVVMTGAAFRFPRMDSLNQDIAGMVAGTLKNYPEESAKAVNAFYLLEHDSMPVQAEKPSENGVQYKHAHAIELIAVAAIEDFFNRADGSLKNRVIIPHYSLPGNGKTNWENMALPEEYRLAMTSRLRFDAVLFYWIAPQLDPLNKDDIYESEMISAMYHGKRGKKLKSAVSYSTLEEQVITPFQILLEREKRWLSWLKDICLTGKNWETGTEPSEFDKTDLFPVTEIDNLLMGMDVNNVGGLSGFNLDRLSECGEGNLYHTNLTPDEVCCRLKYMENRKPRNFMDIMDDLYDVCSSRINERRR